VTLLVLSCASVQAYLHAGATGGLLLQRHARVSGARYLTTCNLQRQQPEAGPAAAAFAAGGDRGPVSRRTVLAGGSAVFAAGLAPRAVHAYEFKKEASGDAVFDVPAVWIKTAEDKEAGTFAFSNPVSGKVLDLITVREYEAPEGIRSTKDVGKIEKLGTGKKAREAFGTTKEVDFADMVSAAVRKGREAGVVFYDFDFAIAPKTCTRENEMLTGSCMYTKIILLSCCVKKGNIYVLEIVASDEEWKKNGPTLRSLRDSFNIPT